MKENSIGSPTQHLGSKVSLATLENGVKRWSFSSSQHVQAAVKNVECYWARANIGPLFKAKSPWPSNCLPEADVTPELAPTKASCYQSLIGVLWWIVELGRGDLSMELSYMASMMALPREGYLNVMFKMFSFLKSKHNLVTVYDPTDP